MILAAMQPYFLPYLGYWQLLHAVDRFIVYDNIQYTKKGWINRNQLLENAEAHLFSLPIKKSGHLKSIQERNISKEFNANALCRRIKNNYQKSPYFDTTYPVLEKIIQHDEKNLFSYLYHSITCICKHLHIDQEKIIASSNVAIDHSLPSEKKLIAFCHYYNANNYYNPIGGQSIYNKKHFSHENIALKFISSDLSAYKQFNHPFVSHLSIIDIMMFCSPTEIQSMLHNYSLI